MKRNGMLISGAASAASVCLIIWAAARTAAWKEMPFWAFAAALAVTVGGCLFSFLGERLQTCGEKILFPLLCAGAFVTAAAGAVLSGEAGFSKPVWLFGAYEVSDLLGLYLVLKASRNFFDRPAAFATAFFWILWPARGIRLPLALLLCLVSRFTVRHEKKAAAAFWGLSALAVLAELALTGTSQKIGGLNGPCQGIWCLGLLTGALVGGIFLFASGKRHSLFIRAGLPLLCIPGILITGLRKGIGGAALLPLILLCGYGCSRVQLLLCHQRQEMKSSLRKAWARAETFWYFRKYPALKEVMADVPAKRLFRQKKEGGKGITFRLLLTVSGNDTEKTERLLQSLLAQTDPHWTLYAAISSETGEELKSRCLEYAARDPRIRMISMPESASVWEGRNACLAGFEEDYGVFLRSRGILHPQALYCLGEAAKTKGADLIYTDQGSFVLSMKKGLFTNYKPDYSPDTLRSYDYMGDLTAFSRTLWEKTGPLSPDMKQTQDYAYRLMLAVHGEKITHIPRVLYYEEFLETPKESDKEQNPAGAADLRFADSGETGRMIQAVSAQLKELGLKARVEAGMAKGTLHVRYEYPGTPLVSVLIPNKDHSGDLERCVRSILEKTRYENYEVIIVENNSTEPETFACYERLSGRPNIRVVTWNGPFNYSAINNFGAGAARGEYLLFLNNDTEVISENWMEEMLMFACRKEVGCVGAMLYYPDDTVQHGGVIFGIDGVAAHFHRHYQRGETGYQKRMAVAQNLSCVTAACMMVPKKVFEQLQGLDEEFAVAFNDIDFCMRVQQAGYLTVFTPYASLYHYESKSRGQEDTPGKQARFQREIRLFQKRWKEQMDQGDPYYNPNLKELLGTFSQSPAEKNQEPDIRRWKP